MLDPHSDEQIVMDILQSISPPLQEPTLQSIRNALATNCVSLSTMRTMGHAELKDKPFQIASSCERARIITHIGKTPYAPAPNKLFGGPVIVRPKLGFTRLAEFDTVTNTVSVRFFLDCYWLDPRIVGKSSVPDGIWRPDGITVPNRYSEMERIQHQENPSIADMTPDGVSENGLLLWPVEFDGTLSNPMDLTNFPYDFDCCTIHLQQSEDTDASEYIFRPYDEPLDEATSVRFFFDVAERLNEWRTLGFSRMGFESVGGIPKAFAHMHINLHFGRKYGYYFWKVILPLLMTTVFCFSSFAFMPHELEARTAISTTMFLATFALLYVISTDTPKLAHLTSIDQLVVATIVIQFLIVITGWITGWSVFATRLENELFPQSLTFGAKTAAEIIDVVMCGTLAVALIIAFLTTFAWPAYKHNRVQPHDWPPTLQRPPPGSSEPGPRPLEVNGKHIGYSYTPPQRGLQQPLASRYFFFEKFLNVFPQIKVGADALSREPDPPADCIAKQSKRAQVALTHAGQDEAYEEGAAKAKNAEHMSA